MSITLRKKTEGERTNVVPVSEQLASKEDAQESLRGDMVKDVAPVSVPDSSVSVPTVVAAPPVALERKSEELLAVESVLSQGLGGIFQTLSPDKQRVFKERGEELAARLVKAAHLAATAFARRAYAWIRSWLTLLPGVSAAFVAQESKIKTDALMELSQKQKSSL